MRDALIRRAFRLAGRLASTDLHLYPAAALALSRRRDRDRRIAVQTDDGFKMRLKLDEYPDGAMYFGIYEPSIVRLLQSILRPGDVAIDAGANIGYITLHLSRMVGPGGRVHSFEPLADNIQRLRESIATNGCSNVTVHPNAIAEKAGTVEFYSFGATEFSGHALGSLRPLGDKHRVVSCESVRMDDVVQGPVRLLKADVEGAEVGTLLAARRIIREHRPHIVVENNPKALAAFGHSFLDVYRAVLSANSEYDAIDLEHRQPRLLREDAILKSGCPAHQCNVWFRPKTSRADVI